MTFSVRAPHEHELDAYSACIDVGFGMRRSALENERFLRGLVGAELLAAFDGDELIGTMATYSVEHTLPGPVVATAGAITDATVLPTHRRRGALSQLMTQSLHALRERGEFLALLHASEGSIYGRFGFGPATFSARDRIERHGAALRASDSQVGSVRMLSATEAQAGFPAVYDEARKTRTGEIARHDVWWEEMFAIAEQAGQPARFFACYEHSGVIEGYVIYEIRGGFERVADRECFVVELCTCTVDAYRGLCRFILGVDLVSRITTDERPVVEPLQFMLVDPRALEVLELKDRTWARIIDLERALVARRYGAPGDLVISVTDPVIPANTRTIELAIDGDGRATVRESDSTPDITCDIASLSTVYLGGVSIGQLGDAGAIASRDEASLRRAYTMFGSEQTPFCTAMF